MWTACGEGMKGPVVCWTLSNSTAVRLSFDEPSRELLVYDPGARASPARSGFSRWQTSITSC